MVMMLNPQGDEDVAIRTFGGRKPISWSRQLGMVRNSCGLCTYRLGGLAGLTDWGRIAGGHPHYFCRLDRNPAGRFDLWGATGLSDSDQAAGPQRYRGLPMRPEPGGHAHLRQDRQSHARLSTCPSGRVCFGAVARPYPICHTKQKIRYSFLSTSLKVDSRKLLSVLVILPRRKGPCLWTPAEPRSGSNWSWHD
jgi:hypothetical protein